MTSGQKRRQREPFNFQKMTPRKRKAPNDEFTDSASNDAKIMKENDQHKDMCEQIVLFLNEDENGNNKDFLKLAKSEVRRTTPKLT